MWALALLLLLYGLAGHIALSHRTLNHATFPYWFFSWIGQSFALPLALFSTLLALFAVLGENTRIATFAMAAPATLMLAILHLRNHAMGRALKATLRDQGLQPAAEIPLLSGLNPLKIRNPQVQRLADIPYGEEGERNLLDIYLPRERPEGPMPILIQIHGGAWILGKKDNQGLPLLYHMAANGWLGVAINYRLGPRWRFPTMLSDVLRAIAWVKEHAREYGGDPSFVALTGGSAGGHLTSLAALLANRPDLQPGFERADTSVSAAVPLYGRYDFLDRGQFWGTKGGAGIVKFMAEKVMPCYPDQDYGLWELGSPVAQVHSGAPPFFVIHGTHDSLIPVEEARLFVAELRRRSNRDVLYAELDGAQHAFDFVASPATLHMVEGVRSYLDNLYSKHRQG